MQRPQRSPHEGDDTRQDRRNQHDRRLAALPQRCHPPRSYDTGPRSAEYAIGDADPGHPCGAGCRAPRIFRLGGECHRRRVAPASRHWPGWQSRANGPPRVDGRAFCQGVDASSPAGHVSVPPSKARPGEHGPHWRCVQHSTRQPHPCRRQAHVGASTGTVINLYNTKL